MKIERTRIPFFSDVFSAVAFSPRILRSLLIERADRDIRAIYTRKKEDASYIRCELSV